MKSAWLPCILLTSLFIICLWNSHMMSRYSQQLQQQLQTVKECLAQQQWEQAKQQLDEYTTLWEKRQLYLHIITEHEEIDQAEDLLVSLYAFIQYEELPESMSELAYLNNQLRLLAEMQEFNWGNTF